MPEVKSYTYKEAINTMYDQNYLSITEAKESILYGGELTFRYMGQTYGISKLENEVFDFYNIDADDGVELSGIEEVLDHKLEGRRLRDIILEIEVLYRTL